MSSLDDFVAGIETRNRRIAGAAALAIFAVAPLVGLTWSWWGAFWIIMLILYGFGKLHMGDEEIAQLRGIISGHHTMMARTESPGVFVPAIVGLVQGTIGLLFGVGTAFVLFCIPGIGWLLGTFGLLASLMFPFYAVYEQLVTCTVTCPRCSRVYSIKPNEGRKCASCPVYLLRVRGVTDALAVYAESD